MSPLTRLALPVLAAASIAYAASCSTDGTTTIQNGGDATAIASCKTYSGSIAIATGAVGVMAINGINTLDGNLDGSNADNITDLNADSIETITGDFILQDNTRLGSIAFPKLTEVGNLKWISVSILTNLGFTAGLTKAKSIDIENTSLQNLEGINLETVGDLKIANNKFIAAIQMQLTEITGSVSFEGNNAELVVKFDQLESASNLTLQACSSISVPLLETVNGSLALLKNTFESFAAPKLTKIGVSLVVNDNTKLTNASFPALGAVGKALQIANNTELHKINGLPKLKTIGADLDFHGNLTEISLPALTDVIGTFNIQSTGDIGNTCDTAFKPLSTSGSGRIRGKYTCIGEVANPGGEGSTPTPTGGNTKKTGAANPLNVQNGALGFAGLFAALFL